MRLYLEYILSICRPSKIAARRQLRTGFTAFEVLTASFILLIVVAIAIQGSMNLMRFVYKANANSDQRDSLHRALNLMSNELRRAKIISTDIPAEWKEKNPILLFYLANPKDPTLTIDKPVVYFVKNSTLFRYGPPMTAQVYRDLDDTGKWQTTAVAFDFQDEITDESTQDCDIYRDDPKWSDKWERFPVSENNKLFVPGIYACIKKDTKSQVALIASTRAEDTMGTSLSFTLSTRVSSPAQNTPYMISNNGEDIPKFKIENGGGGGGDGDVIRIITTKTTDITTKLVEGKCQQNCQIKSVTENADSVPAEIGETLRNVPAGADILVQLGNALSLYGSIPGVQETAVYTLNNPPPADIYGPLQSNQVLLRMTDLSVSPSKDYLLVINFQ